MDKKIEKIKKDVKKYSKKEEKELGDLKKMDKKRDKVCDLGKEMMKKKKKVKQSKKAYIASLRQQLDHEWCGNRDVKRKCSLCRENPCNYDLCVDCLRNMINKMIEK